MNDKAPGAETDDFLSGFFEAGVTKAPEASAALLARVLNDGLAEQASLATPVQSPKARAGLVARLIAGLGGWGPATGFASVVLAGLWIGFDPPTSLAGWADGLLVSSGTVQDAQVEQIDLLPDFESFVVEG